MNELISKLEASAAEGRTLHAYLLSGTDNDFTESTARSLASIILYGHKSEKKLESDADYMEYNGSISIGEFREIIRPEIYRETYGARGRVVVMQKANLLTPIVQNAMLKVLEEPPENTYFILTGNEYGILPTIRSRCMIIRCSSREKEQIVQDLIGLGANTNEASRFASYSGCVTARAVRLYQDASFRELRESCLIAFEGALKGIPDLKWSKLKRERPDYSEAIEFLLLYCHDIMMVKCGSDPDFCFDRASELQKIAMHFTIGSIGCIIKELIETAKRLATNASGGAAFDRLFTNIAEIAVASRAI